MKKILILLLTVVMLIPLLALFSYAEEAPKPEYAVNCAVYNIENQT